MLRALLIVAVAVCMSACDSAPHDNPLDPLSGVQQTGTVSGQVTGTFPPFNGRPAVRVRIIPIGDLEGGPERVTTTDEDGFFSTPELALGSYRVQAEGNGFGAAAQEIVVTPVTTPPVTLRLDALPVVTSKSARTVHVESIFNEVAPYSLEVSATVSDPDEQTEVVGAAVVIDAFDIRVPLTSISSGPNGTVFSATLEEDILPDGRLEPLLGEFLVIEVTDRNGNATRSDPFSLVRIIDPTPAPVSPVSLAIVPPSPIVLEWNAPPLTYATTFEIEVRTNRRVGPLVLVESATLPSTASSYTLQRTLSAGTYLWTIAYVDAAGNRSRSFEGTFEVQ